MAKDELKNLGFEEEPKTQHMPSKEKEKGVKGELQW